MKRSGRDKETAPTRARTTASGQISRHQRPTSGRLRSPCSDRTGSVLITGEDKASRIRSDRIRRDKTFSVRKTHARRRRRKAARNLRGHPRNSRRLPRYSRHSLKHNPRLRKDSADNFAPALKAAPLRKRLVRLRFGKHRHLRSRSPKPSRRRRRDSVDNSVPASKADVRLLKHVRLLLNLHRHRRPRPHKLGPRPRLLPNVVEIVAKAVARDAVEIGTGPNLSVADRMHNLHRRLL